MPAWLPFVTHCFVPPIVQPSASGVAAVRSEPASEPESGSVSANAHLPAREGRHEARALLLGAEGQDRQRRGARVHGDCHADPRVGARELLEHEDVREEVRARTAVLLRHADAHQPKRGEPRVELPREGVLPVPLGRVRLDLGLGELAREGLDLALLRAQVEIHRMREYRDAVRRLILGPFLLLALAGCGGGKALSPEETIRAWSEALNASDNERAADLFAPDVLVIQGASELTLRTHAEAVAWNAGLPCSGQIVSLSARGDTVTATFRLGPRRGSLCDGPGAAVKAVFEVRDGKIVIWHQLPSAAPEV